MRIFGILSLLITMSSALTHGWDCVSCKSNSMLAANFGTFRTDINLQDPWWIETVASSHAAVLLNNFWTRSYNGTGDDSKVVVARALKKSNPELNVYFYQPADRLGDTPFIQNVLKAHPEWWLRDDNGIEILFGGSMHQIDPSVVAAQDYFANLSISLFHDHAEAVSLLDGVFVDGVGYRNPDPVNISQARYEKIFAGQMAMMEKLTVNLKALNPSNEAIGNPLLAYNAPENSPEAKWNISLAHYGGAFDEMFGSFLTMQGGLHGNGEWDAEKMRFSMDAIINASAAGKTVMIHSFPGPATVPFPTIGDAATHNTFRAASWAGKIPAPTDATAARAASQARLVESLAPFLIVATERVFFGYGWFYNIEDGYIPCPSHIECGMPNEWFPEFSKPIGEPRGPATTDAERNVWTRRFAHANVTIDLRDRTLSHIGWETAN
jgi:hypothetical protein